MPMRSQPTQSICPESNSFRCSPPWGLLASSRIAALEPSTNTTPMTASCTSGQRRSVQVSSRAPASAAANAATCTAAP